MLHSRYRSARARTTRTKGIHGKPTSSRKRPTRLCPSSCVLSPLLSFLFPLPPTQTLGPLCRGRSMGSHQTHGLFRQCRETRTFDAPQGGHAASPCFSKAGPWLLCSHPELVCTLAGGPQPPCRSRSRPDPQIKAAGLTGQSRYQSRDKRHRPRCSCQDSGSSAGPTPQG